MRIAAARHLVASLLVLALVGSAIGAPPSEVAQAQGLGEAFEQVLPPGARQLLAVVRVFKGLSARNRVYREAGRVQRQLRGYYTARIKTAERMRAEREQRGLRPSQVAAYDRAIVSLKAERKAALKLTENEKRAAKYRFEGRLRREVFGALLRTPKAQTALRGVRDTLGKFRQRFGQVKAALEGGSPVEAVVKDLKRQVAKLRAAGQIVSLVSGKAGADLLRKVRDVERVIDNVSFANERAIGITDQAIGALAGAEEALDGHLQAPYDPRAARDMLISELVGDLEARIFTPGGETPVEDLLADAIARGFEKDLVRNVGVAVGALDPAALRTMRERVRAQLLADKLGEIAAVCGRYTGAVRDSAVDSLEGDADPPASTPCALFRNPDALGDFIRKLSGTGEAARGSQIDVGVDPRFPSVSAQPEVTPEQIGGLIELLVSRLTLSRDGDDLRMVAVVKTLSQTGPPNPPCLVTLERRFSGTASAAGAREVPWRFEGDNTLERSLLTGPCSRDVHDSFREYETSPTVQVDGNALSGYFEGHHWVIEDASAVLDLQGD